MVRGLDPNETATTRAHHVQSMFELHLFHLRRRRAFGKKRGGYFKAKARGIHILPPAVEQFRRRRFAMRRSPGGHVLTMRGLNAHYSSYDKVTRVPILYQAPPVSNPFEQLDENQFYKMSGFWKDGQSP